MAYNTYSENVTTTPETIFDIDTDGGYGPKIIRVWCTTQNVTLQLVGPIPPGKAEDDQITIVAGEDPKEITSVGGFRQIIATAATGTAVLNLESVGYA